MAKFYKTIFKITMKKVCLSFALLSMAHADPSLDAIALSSGTDKSSAFHNYTPIYSQYFEQMRSKPIKFLEIGVYQGASAKMWEEYFPKAELHFIDIELDRISHKSPRCHYHFVDQRDRKQLEDFANSVGGNFDVIIDDGGHVMDMQITSFKTLFPFLKSGGIYVIEDMHASYSQDYEGGNSFTDNTCMNFLFHLLDDLNFVGAVTMCADREKAPPSLKKVLTPFQESIASIHFYPSLCIVIKK